MSNKYSRTWRQIQDRKREQAEAVRAEENSNQHGDPVESNIEEFDLMRDGRTCDEMMAEVRREV